MSFLIFKSESGTALARDRVVLTAAVEFDYVELCDRILVIGSGKITGVVDGRNTTKEEIGILMTKSDKVNPNGNGGEQ